MNPALKTTYILLRDNKETGPFTFDQLREMGLKSSDLLWVEGQSVYWLTAAQIPELKALPLDLVPEQVIPEEQAIPALEKQAEPPAPSATMVKETAAAPAYGSLKKDWEQYSPSYQAPKKSVASEPVTSIPKQPAEVKEMYFPKSTSVQKFSLPDLSPSLKKGLFYGGLLLAGIAVGLFINRGGRKEKVIALQTAPIVNSMVRDTAATITDTLPDVNQEKVIPAPQDEIVDKKPAEKESTKRSLAPQKDSEFVPQRNTTVVAVEEKEENKEAEVKEIKPKRENFASHVSVRTNDYTVGSFGGIRNLELTVNNESGYTLEKVVAEIKYYKPGDELLKTETIYFYRIPPNASQTLPIKKSNRGVKVTTRIIKIDPREQDQ